jgi:hypothetical protein
MPGGEIFETGFWMSETGVHDEGTANALAQIIAGTLNSVDSSGAMRITSVNLWKASISWTEVRTYAYTGGSVAAYIGSFILSPARAGSSSGAVLSNQTSMCVSLRTGLAGRRNRGRMYLPVNGLALDLDGQWTGAQVQPIANAWALAFTDINASDTGKIIVVSQVAGSFHQVTSCIIDTRPDVVRRRANQQTVNGRTTAAVTP